MKILLFLFAFLSTLLPAPSNNGLINISWGFLEADQYRTDFNVCRSYTLEFREDGTGLLSLALTYDREDQKPGSYNGRIHFQFEALEEENHSYRVKFQELEWQHLANVQTDLYAEVRFDADYLEKIKSQMDHMTEDWVLQKAGQSYLRIDGISFSSSNERTLQFQNTNLISLPSCEQLRRF